MTAQMRILQHENLADILRELKDIDPGVIKQIEEEKRKQAALTTAELAKVSEARAYIVKYDGLVSDIEEKTKNLQERISVHETNVSSFNEKNKKETERLKKLEDELNAIKVQNDEIAQSHINYTNALDERSKKIESDHAEWERKFNEKLDTVNSTETLQKVENERLLKEDKRLKDKAKRIAAEAAN